MSVLLLRASPQKACKYTVETEPAKLPSPRPSDRDSRPDSGLYTDQEKCGVVGKLSKDKCPLGHTLILSFIVSLSIASSAATGPRLAGAPATHHLNSYYQQ